MRFSARVTLRIAMAVGFVVVLGGAYGGVRADAAGLRCPEPLRDLDDEQQCGGLVVPLDRSDAVAGTVTVPVARMRTQRPKATPLLALTGDDPTAAPSVAGISLDTVLQGQGRDFYVLGDRAAVVARVCGDLRPLRSPARGASCAAALGAARRHLGPADVAEDAAAVVAALRLPRVVVFATGGGAEAGIRFAAAHPERVERLIVDAPSGDAAGDPLRARSVGAALGALRDICALARCPTADVAGALRTAVAHAGEPGAGASSSDLARLVLDAPLRRLPSLPAALVAANGGDVALLRRLVRSVRPASPQPWELARACGASWPWDAAAAPAQRLAAVAAVPADPLPAEALVATAAVTQACAGWPDDGQRSAPLPVPPMPTLVTAGAWDRVGTPGAAQQIHEALPGSSMTLLQERDEGLRANAPSACGDRTLRRFLTGRAVPRSCSPPGPRDAVIGRNDALALPPEDVPPMRLRDVPAARVLGSGRAARVLGAVVATVNDVVDEAERVGDPSASFAGLRGGRILRRGGGFVLRDVVYVPGVVVRGEVLHGRHVMNLRVGGAAAGRGGRVVVDLTGLRAFGRVDGRRLRARLTSRGGSYAIVGR